MSQVTINQALQIAMQHHQAGRVSQAEATYQQILARQPNHAQALHLLGILAHQTGRHDVAVDLIRSAVVLIPNWPEAHSNLGVALQARGSLDEAIASFRQAAALAPENPAALNNLGNSLKESGRGDEAIAAYRQAISLKPEYAEAHHNLGAALKEKGQLNEAIAAYGRAIELKPAYADAHNNLGVALKGVGRIDEAVASIRRAIALKPQNAIAYSNLGFALVAKAQLDEAIVSFRKAIALDPKLVDAHSNLLVTLNYHPASTPQSLLAESRRWAERHAGPLRNLIRPFANDRDPDRRLKVGYVSPDLREHVVGRALLPFLNECDTDRYEAICYSHAAVADAMTQRIRLESTQWRETGGLSPDRLADLIRQDQIDILVDLSGHCGDHRLLTFACKPAPVQVTWLGFPGTTGMSAMDYRITDDCLDPPDAAGGRDALYAERSIRLPNGAFCYHPPRPIVPVSPLPALATRRITFGCLNNLCKVTAFTFDAWMQILRTVPASDLLLYAAEGEIRQQIRDAVTAKGIDPNRVRFVGHGGARYFEMYHQIDISLDPFPFTGSTTTCDSLWMGVPVVTLAGPSIVSRLSLTILSNLGLTEFIANDSQGYVNIAIAVAKDLPRLTQMRSALRQRMLASTLMNAPAFARNLETAFRAMWRQWCEAAR